MENESLRSLLDRLRFRSLPFDEEAMTKRLADRILNPVAVSVLDTVGEQKYGRKWQILAVAASLAFVFMTGWLLLEKAVDPEPVFLETTAVPDAKTRIILPDSTSVWLNANATLRYPVRFSGEMRHVELSGEAFFEVSHDEKLPFVVSADGLNIKVLGTSFSVDARDGHTEVALISGSVALYTCAYVLGDPDLILKPGERAIFYNSGNKLESSAMRPEQATSWVTGQFIFRDSSLEEIMHELQRAFHVKIYIDNSALADLRFDADFTDHETLDEILEILKISARYTIERYRGEIHLK